MAAFNIVRFRVKPGREEDFLNAHRHPDVRWPGLVKGTMVKTGERSYCLVVEWSSMDAIVAARPQMIARLDVIRDMLEDLGGGLGVTDPVSGPAVLDLLPKS
jgi:hypothetical protein